MPIVSQTASVKETYLELVNNILIDCGEQKVTTLISPAQRTEAIMSMLNLTVEEIYSKADWWFKQEDWTYGPEAGITKRSLPDDFDDLASDPRDPSRALTFIQPQELDKYYPIQDTTDVDGTPLYYTFWADGNANQQIHLYPPPDSTYTASKVCKIVGPPDRYFVAKLDFTSDSAVDTPLSGSDWEDYWVEDDGISSATAYADTTDYKSGRIQVRYYRRPQAMAADAHYPDIPNKFFDILKTGARARYKQYREDTDWQQETALFQQKLTMAARRHTQIRKGHRVRLFR